MIPGFVGEILSGFLYLYAMLVAYALRWIIGKLGFNKYLDRGTQVRISGFCIDMMVTSAFMGISPDGDRCLDHSILAVVVSEPSLLTLPPATSASVLAASTALSALWPSGAR